MPPIDEMEGLRDFLVAASRGGGRNFRTIGDWPTLEGRRVLRGKVFRSGHLGELADEVRAEVSGLGLRTVVTLQTVPTPTTTPPPTTTTPPPTTTTPPPTTTTPPPTTTTPPPTTT